MTRAALLADVPHLFTGRAEGDLSTLAPGRSDAAARVARELGTQREGRTQSIPAPLTFCRQVHGTAVRIVTPTTTHGETDADAMITLDHGVALAIRVADCVPILLAAPGGVAAIHAGWRGTAADITRITLTQLVALTGCRVEDVRAAIGPAICADCYEVGGEVVAAVAAVSARERFLKGERHVDLRAANAAVLIDAGVRVELVPGCTRCGTGYWSFRRDGPAAGRQAAVIQRGGKA